MNRGLALALIILAFAVTLIGADTILLSDAIGESEAALSACRETKDGNAASSAAAVRASFEQHRFLFSVSLPLACISEYERSIAALESAAASQDKDAFLNAHSEAAHALSQMKRSALFSLEQIF